MAKDIWVFSEKMNLLAELIGGAMTIASQSSGAVVAVVLGTKQDVDQAAAMGASTVLWLGALDTPNLLEDFIPTITGLVKQHHPAVMLIGATKRGKVVAGRVAAQTGASVVTDAKQLTVENGCFQATHMIFGGGAVRVEKAKTETLLATIGMGMFEAAAPDTGRKAEIKEVPFVEPKWRLILRERKQKPPSTVNLAAAKRVICPGRGVSKQEDMEMINDLARTLEAEIGCTRPLAEGLDWLPRERYIGVSGAFIKPDLYIGIGVSGQVQHTVGITESKIVVGINKDEHAPIFPQADYGIVGDLYAIVPLLIKGLKARK